jgi:hypothetical protein
MLLFSVSLAGNVVPELILDSAGALATHRAGEQMKYLNGQLDLLISSFEAIPAEVLHVYA